MMLARTHNRPDRLIPLAPMLKTRVATSFQIEEAGRFKGISQAKNMEVSTPV